MKLLQQYSGLSTCLQARDVWRHWVKVVCVDADTGQPKRGHQGDSPANIALQGE